MTREVADTEMLVATLAGKAEGATGPHPDLESLLAYRAGTLPQETEQSVRDHLVGCRDCTRGLLDLADFQEAGQEPPSSVADLASVAAWRDFKTRLAESGRPAGQRYPRVLYPLAASLLLGVAALSFWVAGLRATNAELRRDVAELSAVQVNPPLFYLDEATRSDGAGVLVELSPQQPYFLVFAVPGTTTGYSTFEAELTDASGQVVWRAESGLSDADTLRFVFHRDQFPPGDYRMRVYGVDGGHKELANDELLSLRQP